MEQDPKPLREEPPQSSDIAGLGEAWTVQWRALRSLPFKPVFILLSVTLVQILTHYYTSRSSFRALLETLQVQQPYNEFYEYCLWLLGDFLFQFPLLVLCVRFILKDSLSNHGVQRGNSRLGIKIAMVFGLCMTPVLWFVSADPVFLELHPAPLLAKTDWGMFWLYELCSVVYLVGWEFVWRGYMLLGLKEYLGYYAVLIQAIPFTLLHLAAPELEAYGAVIAGIGLGMLAVATRSFWYCVVLHALVLGTMDVLGALRFRTGTSGIGVQDIMDLISKNF